MVRNRLFILCTCKIEPKLYNIDDVPMAFVPRENHGKAWVGIKIPGDSTDMDIFNAAATIPLVMVAWWKNV
jgi:hypothetical protein